MTGCDGRYLVTQGGRQRGIESLVLSRLGDGPEQSLKELARNSPSTPAAHAEALRACKHAGLIWHAFSHFRKALQVPVPSCTSSPH